MNAEVPEDEPFIATFLLVLPDPLPVPHGSTWTTMLEEPEPLLDGVELRPLRDLERLATTRGQGEGRNFVSLRFWQVRDDQAVRPLYLHRSLAAAQVANALNPNATGDPEFLSVTDLDVESSITVVEAGTFVASNSELTAGDGKPDPLTRCVDVLTEFHRSYRVMTDEHVPELTYERLHPWSCGFVVTLSQEMRPHLLAC